jgi:hypothetical protein
MAKPSELPVNESVAAILGGRCRIGVLSTFNGFIAFSANPGMCRGGIVPPTPVLAPGSALRSRPRVALSSAQVVVMYRGPRPAGNSPVRLRRQPGGLIPGELQSQPRIRYLATPGPGGPARCGIQ